MAKDIKFNIKLQIDGKEQIAVASTDTKEFAKQLRYVKKEAADFGSKSIVFNQFSEGIRNATDSLRRLSEAMSDIVRVNMQVSQITGTTGREMLKLKSDAKVLADYMGSDLNEILIAANSLAKGFGISAGQALDMIRTGFVSGGNANGEFLDILREYPRYFKEAGISAEEFIAITVNAAQQGIFSDKGVDAIKEANIRIREMTTATAAALDGIGISSVAVQQALQDGTMTTFDVMQQVSARLKELPASASAVGTAIADIFGGPGEDAGLEYLKTLGDITLNLEDVKGAAGDAAAGMEKQIKAMQKFSGAFKLFDLSGFYAQIQPFIRGMGELGMAIMALQNIRAVIPALKDVTMWLTRGALQSKAAGAAALLMGQSAKRSAVLLRVFSAALKTGAYSATALKLALKGLMSATIIGAVLTAIISVVEALVKAFSKAKAGAEELQEAEQEYVSAAANAKVQIEEDIKSLKALMDAHGDTAGAVQTLNEKYGDIFGTYQTAEEWYDKLISKSGDYIKMKGYEAQAIALASKMAEISIKKEVTARKMAEMESAGTAYKSETIYTPEGVITNTHNTYETRAYRKLREEYEALVQSEAAVKEEQRAAEALLTEIQASLAGATTVTPTTVTPTGSGDLPIEGSIDYINAQMDELRKKINATADEKETKALVKRYKELEAQLKTKRIALGLELEPELPDEKTGLEELQEKLQTAQERFDNAVTVEAKVEAATEVADIQRQIDEGTRGLLTISAETSPLYIVQGSDEDKRKSYDNARSRISSIQQDYEIGLIGKEDAQAKIDALNAQLANLGLKPIEVDLEVNTDDVDIQEPVDKFGEGFQKATSMWGGIRSIGSGVDSLTNALDENASAWQRLTGIVDGFLGIIQGLQGVISIIKAITGATEAAGDAAMVGSAKEVAASAASTAAKNTETTANVAAAASGALAAHSGIPFVGIALGLAAVAAIVAAMLSLPKFAKGGIVSGPTLAMVGEYAGASGNPEVIAPLDKLRGMLVQSNGTDPKKVVFEIKGRRLVGVLNKENDIYTRN